MGGWRSWGIIPRRRQPARRICPHGVPFERPLARTSVEQDQLAQVIDIVDLSASRDVYQGAVGECGFWGGEDVPEPCPRRPPPAPRPTPPLLDHLFIARPLVVGALARR